jgi:hypothetical protein
MVIDFVFVVRPRGISLIRVLDLSSGRGMMMMMRLMALRMRGLKIPQQIWHQGHHIWRSMGTRLDTLLAQLRYRLLRWL